MAWIFVDGSIHQVHSAPVIRAGGTGVILVSPHSTKGLIAGYGRYYSPSATVTNQRMELEAIRQAIVFARRCGVLGQPLHIWSDSEYAIGSLRPGSDWSPTKNLDLIVPTQRLLRQSNVASLRHVRSHIDRKTGGVFPNFVLHEMADVIAQTVVKRQLHAEVSINRGTMDPVCLACSLFPCRTSDEQTAYDRMRLSDYPQSCEKFIEWPDMAIKGFSRKEVVKLWDEMIRAQKP